MPWVVVPDEHALICTLGCYLYTPCDASAEGLAERTSPPSWHRREHRMACRMLIDAQRYLPSLNLPLHIPCPLLHSSPLGAGMQKAVQDLFTSLTAVCLHFPHAQSGCLQHIRATLYGWSLTTLSCVDACDSASVGRGADCICTPADSSFLHTACVCGDINFVLSGLRWRLKL